MCCAIDYQGKRHYFKHGPQLPVLCRDGTVTWVHWGLPYGITLPGVPNGACARRESLLDGKWTRLAPRPVRIPCAQYMERDAARAEHWFDVADGMAIQGALVTLPQPVVQPDGSRIERVVYVVTEPARGAVAGVHDRMPRQVPLASD